MLLPIAHVRTKGLFQAFSTGFPLASEHQGKLEPSFSHASGTVSLLRDEIYLPVFFSTAERPWRRVRFVFVSFSYSSCV